MKLIVGLYSFLFIIGASAKVQIAVVYNHDGPSNSTSNPIEGHIKKGVELAIKDEAKNKDKFDVVWINHSESTAGTMQAIDQINKIKPRYVVGMGDSYQAILAAKYMNKDTILITPVATSDEIVSGSKSVFLFSNSNSKQADILVDLIKTKVHRDSPVLLVNMLGCAYCTNLSSFIEKRLIKDGIEFKKISFHISDELFTVNDKNLMGSVSHVVLPVHELEAGKLISTFSKINKDLHFWGGDGWGTLGRFVSNISNNHTINATWLSHYHYKIDTPENLKFVAKFRAEYENQNPVDTSALYYEAMSYVIKLISSLSSKSINHEKYEFKSLSGLAVIVGQKIERPMVKLNLKKGHVEYANIVRMK